MYDFRDNGTFDPVAAIVYVAFNAYLYTDFRGEGGVRTPKFTNGDY